MMNNDKENHKKYYQILELEENASLADINQAYKKLKDLYSFESIVTDAIEDEFSQEERQEIVNKLEEAYKILISFMVEKDRVGKDEIKKEEEMADTAKEEDEENEKEREAKEEAEEDHVLELDEEVRINNEIPEDISSKDAFNTIPAPIDLPEEVEGTQVFVHENEIEHEHVHIELPEKEELKEEKPQENAFEIVPNDVDEDKKGSIWDESIFEKDIKDIKNELTKDIKMELTIVQKKPGEEKSEFDGLEIKGRTLRKIREKLGFGIHEIAVASKINYKVLVNIEKERFSKLPDAGHLRWYLFTYAKALFLEPQKVADEYMKRFRLWKRKRGEE